MVLRELFAKLGLGIDAQSFAKGQLLVEGIKFGLSTLAATAIQTGHDFLEAIRTTAAAGKEIKEMASATGLTTASLQELRAAARASGIDVSSFDTAVFRLSRTMYAAKKGGDEQTKLFARLKVRYKDTNGALRNTDDTLLNIANAFQAMPDGAEKTALAMELFGRSGARIIPWLNKGEAAINAYRSEAVVMTDEQLEAAREVGHSQEQLANVTTKLWRGAIAPLLPAINELLQQYLAWRKATADLMRQRIAAFLGYGIKAVHALMRAFQIAIGVIGFFTANIKTVAYILGVGAFAIGLVKAIALIRSLSLYTTLLGVLSSGAALRAAGAWLLAAAPFIVIAGVVTLLLGVFDDLRRYGQGKSSLFGRFKKDLDAWLSARGDDPWWLRAFKELVIYLEKALGLIDKLGFNKQKQIERSVQGVEYYRNERGERVSTGGNPLALPFGEKGATHLSLPARIDQFLGRGPFAAPEPPQYTPPPGSGVLAPQFKAEFHFTPAPGESPRETFEAWRPLVDEWWDSKMEEAHAATGR